MGDDLQVRIDSIIRDVATERGLEVPTELRADAELVDDLGFSSLTVAALVANLEEALGVDPFQEDEVMITDVRTVGDLRAVYERRLQDTA